MRRVHICAGGEWDILPRLETDDVVIGVDGGALRLLEAGIVPHVAVGDFDTIGEAGAARLAKAGAVIERHPPEKDMTDTELALERAVRFQPDEIVLYGGIGTRLDHTLANLHLLWKAHRLGVRMTVESRLNRVVLLSERFPSCTVKRDRFAFISLLPLSERVTGVTLNGFRYPLADAVLAIGSTLGVSNEWTGEQGEVRIASGALLVIAASDR